MKVSLHRRRRTTKSPSQVHQDPLGSFQAIPQVGGTRFAQQSRPEFCRSIDVALLHSADKGAPHRLHCSVRKPLFMSTVSVKPEWISCLHGNAGQEVRLAHDEVTTQVSDFPRATPGSSDGRTFLLRARRSSALRCSARRNASALQHELPNNPFRTPHKPRSV